MKRTVKLLLLNPVERFLIWLCKTRPCLYMACYLGSFLLFLAAGAATPFITRSIVYPIYTQQSRETGIIEEVDTGKEKVYIFGGHGRFNTYSHYRFVVDGLSIQVPPEDYRNYEKGDLYSYYLYRINEKSIGDYHDYRFGQGVLLLILVIFISLISMSFIFTETSEKELEKKEKFDKLAKGPPGRPKFESCSTEELYEQCLSEGITIRKGKNRDRKYLMECLMNIHETKAYRYQSALKEKRRSKVMDRIFVVTVFVMAANYMRHAFYLFYLFFG